MISPSLRNLRTTLWSILHATSRQLRRTVTSRRKTFCAIQADFAPGVLVLLAVCAILSSVGVSIAQDTTGRAELSESANPLPPDTLTGPLPDALLQPAPESRRLQSTAESGVRRQAGRDGFKPSPTNNSAAKSALPEPSRAVPARPATGLKEDVAVTRKTTARAVSSTQDYRASASNAVAADDENRAASPDTWQQEYSGHVAEVLSGGDLYFERETIGDWWRRRLPHVEMVPVEPGRLKASARDFIEEHTLPPEHDYAVDVYDQKAISVASSQTVTTVRQSAVNESSGQAVDEPGKDRLRTDIRKIRPTLSYAMRNIDAGQLPEGFDDKLDPGEYVARQSSPAVLQWAPTNLYHYPLYFEDPSLERYGHTYHPIVQPFASAGRFATQLVGLPYQMALHPVHSREYTLGYYRPGECAPKKHYQIPFNEEAAIAQAAAMAGFFLIFP